MQCERGAFNRMNGYLFAGYTVIWTILVLYLLYLNKKQRQMSEKLKTLSQALRHEHLEE
jgi:CcmD family protein